MTNRIKEIKRSIKIAVKYAPWVVLWSLLLTISFLGLSEVLFFIPDSWAIPDQYGQAPYQIKLIFALIISIGIVYFASHLYFRTKDLERVIKIFRSNDKNLLAKLRESNAGNYLAERDIPLSLILEKRRQILGFRDYNAAVTMHDFDALWDSMPLIYEKVSKIIEEITDYDPLYQSASKLEKLFLENLPTKLKKEYKKELYYLRVNFIDHYLKTASSDNFIKFGNVDEKERPVAEFYKMILNIFYKDTKGYKKQKTSFNLKELEVFLKEAE